MDDLQTLHWYAPPGATTPANETIGARLVISVDGERVHYAERTAGTEMLHGDTTRAEFADWADGGSVASTTVEPPPEIQPDEDGPFVPALPPADL
ncbi:hypothetical protein ABEV34_05045 [Methylorubrum rhodesianum]|uniref:hypothetical protein n=1 Tax=Methylorubrum rhodesianum TaxID=29427 RepID=UPI003D2DD8FB